MLQGVLEINHEGLGKNINTLLIGVFFIHPLFMFLHMLHKIPNIVAH